MVGPWWYQVVSMLAFYSDDQSSNPAEALIFSGKFVFEKSKNKQKEVHLKKFTNWFLCRDLMSISGDYQF